MFNFSMLNQLSIRAKILALISLLGLLVSANIGIYTPFAAKNSMREILSNDVRFIANLLADNLSVGIQTSVLDNGAALDQTLQMLTTYGKLDEQAISDVKIYDEKGVFVRSLNQSASNDRARMVTDLSIREEKDVIRTWSPMRDINKNVVGYVQIDFSKSFLNWKANKNLTSSIVIALIVLSSTLLLGFLLARNITVGINRVVDIMNDIARGNGDLTRRLPADSKDEIGRLNERINAFMDKLHDLVAQVKDNAEQVSGTASEVTTASTLLAAGAEEQNSRSSEVSASVEEMTTSILQNAQSAGQTAKTAEEANTIAKQGSEAMARTREGMIEIVNSTGRTGDIVKTLSGRAEQIGAIIQVIDKIADQTNLLALNAAVEAARAGEQGAGFAVVADEVRKLAERTTDATKEIAETIKAIQNDTREASSAMKETSQVVDMGRQAAVQTEMILGQIVLKVTQAMDMIQQIAAASEEQSAGAEEISSSVESISAITKQSASGAETLSAAAQELNTQTELLRKVVNQFKLKG